MDPGLGSDSEINIAITCRFCLKYVLVDNEDFLKELK